MNEGANGDEDLMPNSPLSAGFSPKRSHKRQKSKFINTGKSIRQTKGGFSSAIVAALDDSAINEYPNEYEYDAKTHNI